MAVACAVPSAFGELEAAACPLRTTDSTGREDDSLIGTTKISLFMAMMTCLPFGAWEIGVLLLYVGAWGSCYCAFADAFPRMRVTLLTSRYRDEVQVPVNPETMEPLPAHE